MQSLALDVNVVSEEGTRAEMREEDDDLLRAAEELGIDLSGVRADATARPPTRQTEAEDETTPRRRRRRGRAPTRTAVAEAAGDGETSTAA